VNPHTHWFGPPIGAHGSTRLHHTQLTVVDEQPKKKNTVAQKQNAVVNRQNAVVYNGGALLMDHLFRG
jgi:hypothetical protein